MIDPRLRYEAMELHRINGWIIKLNLKPFILRELKKKLMAKCAHLHVSNMSIHPLSLTEHTARKRSSKKSPSDNYKMAITNLSGEDDACNNVEYFFQERYVFLREKL